MSKLSKDGAPKKLGYVPSSFLKKCEDAGEFQSTVELEEKYLGFVSSNALESIDPSMKYITIEDYFPDDPRQISFMKGTLLVVLERSEDGKKYIPLYRSLGYR